MKLRRSEPLHCPDERKTEKKIVKAGCLINFNRKN